MAPKNRAKYRENVAKAFTSVLTEKGLSWKEEWDFVSAAPRSAVTGARYHGINQFYLALISLYRGYTDPRWATMTQIMDKKGLYHPGEKWHLQAGSKAVFVEYWYPYDTQENKMVRWKDYRHLTKEELESGRYALRVRHTPVFHASMIDGISPWAVPAREPQKLSDVVDTLSKSMGVKLLYDGGNRAFYRPSEDKIHLPAPTAFHGEYEFNATALHELAHATGHETRLNRPHGALFGSKEYAYEELVAEISSCFMSVNLDVQQMPQHLKNHRAYVQRWIEAIEEKPETLAQAIADAQRAAQYMDYHAGLISEQEYNAGREGSLTVPANRTSEPAAAAGFFAKPEPEQGHPAPGRTAFTTTATTFWPYWEQVQTVYEYETVNHVPEPDRITTYSPEVGTTVARLARGVTEDNIKERFNEIREDMDRTHEAFETMAGQSMTFSIYQVNTKADRAVRFAHLNELAREGLAVSLSNYDKVYTAPLEPGMTLEDVFRRFNLDRPIDFTGHSLSVSDVVVVNYPGSFTANYVESAGYEELPDLAEQIQTLEGYVGKRVALDGNIYEVIGTNGDRMLLQDVNSDYHREATLKQFWYEEEAPATEAGRELSHAEITEESAANGADEKDDRYEHIELFGKPALFTSSRLTQEKVPKGWYKYELCGNYADPGQFATIAYRVVIDHTGTILSPRPVAMPKDSGQRFLGRGLRFLGEKSGVVDFCDKYGYRYNKESGADCPQKDPDAIQAAAERMCACYDCRDPEIDYPI